MGLKTRPMSHHKDEFLLFFETRLNSVVQVDLEFVAILLPQLLKCWVCRCGPLCLALSSLFKKIMLKLVYMWCVYVACMQVPEEARRGGSGFPAAGERDGGF